MKSSRRTAPAECFRYFSLSGEKAPAGAQSVFHDDSSNRGFPRSIRCGHAPGGRRVVRSVTKSDENFSKNVVLRNSSEAIFVHEQKSQPFYGISQTKDEKDLVITEAKEILDVEDVIASILLVDNLRIKTN